MDDYAVNFFVWKIDYADNKKTKKHIKDGNMKLSYLSTAQCSPELFTEIKSLDEFEDLEDLEAKQDDIRLLGLIWEVMCSVEKNSALVIADKALHSSWTCQTTSASNSSTIDSRCWRPWVVRC